jgi:mono/diheme cytochrome c family protein
MRVLTGLLALAALGAGAFWVVTAPRGVEAAALAAPLPPDAARGQAVFDAAGCASCHMAPGAKGEARLVLAGGQAFATDFGTFYAPNVSMHPELGVGLWSYEDFAAAVMAGEGPDGQHLYPALPYTAYARMTAQEIADLWAYWQGLPADATPSRPHEVPPPFGWRRLLGGWKVLFAGRDWAVSGDLPPEAARGRHLAEALAHCGECHTPRNLLGGPDRSRWLAGVRDATGREVVPNITPAALGWSEAEIVDYLTTGFTPEFDSVGGHMAHVVGNMARLPEADRRAIAAYLKRVPPAE